LNWEGAAIAAIEEVQKKNRKRCWTREGVAGKIAQREKSALHTASQRQLAEEF
jgi:hypothetical protein